MILYAVDFDQGQMGSVFDHEAHEEHEGVGFFSLREGLK